MTGSWEVRFETPNSHKNQFKSALVCSKQKYKATLSYKFPGFKPQRPCSCERGERKV